MAPRRRQSTGKVTVATGTGPGGRWALLWPRHLWEELSEEERAAVVARQRALLEALDEAAPLQRGQKHGRA